jgi:glutathione S-transferase
MPLTLYEIFWSHFCEKARFCLDVKGLDYRRVEVDPPTRRQVKRLGAKGLVPVLQDGGQVVEGSGAIAAHLDRRWPDPPLVPGDPVERAAVLAWQERLDDELGPDARRLGYAVALEHPRLLRGTFLATRAPRRWLNGLLLRALDPILRRRFAIRPQEMADSRRRLARLLPELSDRLAGRGHLVGDTLTLADITAVSLLDPLEIVPEIVRDPALAPLFTWKRALGRAHRRPMRTPWLGGEPTDGVPRVRE